MALPPVSLSRSAWSCLELPPAEAATGLTTKKTLNNVIAASFRCRATKEWDTLLGICINSSTLSGFKTSFAKIFKPVFID